MKCLNVSIIGCGDVYETFFFRNVLKWLVSVLIEVQFNSVDLYLIPKNRFKLHCIWERLGFKCFTLSKCLNFEIFLNAEFGTVKYAACFEFRDFFYLRRSKQTKAILSPRIWLRFRFRKFLLGKGGNLNWRNNEKP